MNIEVNRPVTIFRKDFDDRTVYSMGISKKDINGDYVNGYVPVMFPKGVTIDNKTRIYIRQAWLSFSLVEGRTRLYIFINDFETVKETIEKAKEEYNDPFSKFAEEHGDNYLD